jgi:2-aminoadipate transaminase
MVGNPQLDVHSKIPLYQQLHHHFAQLIRSGTMASGEKLPPTRELAGLLGLNRTTVSAAYELLEAEGLISGQVGRGSFVMGASAAVPGKLDWRFLLSHDDAAPPLPYPSGLHRDVISFATSRPSEDLFPVEAFRASCEQVLSSAEFRSILQLGSPGGYEPLRRYLLDTARHQGLAKPDDDLIVTNGCQQALDLLQRVLAPPSERVALEDPVYPGAKNLFASGGAGLVGIPTGPDGLDPAEVQRVFEKQKPKLLVVTSNFQNPTGATIPLTARHAILRCAKHMGVVLIENDTYGELRYEGSAIPSFKQLDETGDTILIRSFSKVAFPGLRVGWALGPRPVIARMIEAKQLTDLHTDQLSQAVLLRFAESGGLAEHQARMLKAGAQRLAAVLAGCERYLPPGTTFTRPQGGMNLWVKLPAPLDGAELLARAQRAGVVYLPGKFFEISRHQAGALRLSFAGLSPAAIQEGLRILGRVFREELEQAPGCRSMESAQAVV